MSDNNYKITAIGREEFVLPFGMTGFEIKKTDSVDEAVDYISSQEKEKTFFIMDEGIIDNIDKIKQMEEQGISILLLKPWGKSEMAERKIRKASITAVGSDILKEQE